MGRACETRQDMPNQDISPVNILMGFLYPTYKKMMTCQLEMVLVIEEEHPRVMKYFKIIPLILILFTCFACERQQKGPSHLSVGKARLIQSGLAIEAVAHLTKAEKNDADRDEARALLIIAYSYALSSDAAKAQKVEDTYKQQRSERIAALNDAEITKMIEILSKRSQVQQDGFQALVDKGADAAVVILNHYADGTSPDAHKHFPSILTKMGNEVVNPIMDRITDAAITPDDKIKLIRVIGEIGDKKAVEKLKAIDLTNMSEAFKLEVYTTLYRLGDTSYKTQILTGLKSDDIDVRRASAKAMPNLKNVNTDTLINALKDDDSQVIADIAKALAVHKTKDAHQPLLNVFRGTYDAKTKEIVLDTLATYTEAGGELRKGLARSMASLLISQEIKSDQDRIRLAKFLKDRLVNQLKATMLRDDLKEKLYQYTTNVEKSEFVITALHELLDELR